MAVGEPSDKTEELGKVSADMAFRFMILMEMEGTELIVGWIEIRILDEQDRKYKKSAVFSDDDDADLIGVPYQTYAFERINPDGIRICNFRGKGRNQQYSDKKAVIAGSTLWTKI
ncbi:MAG: hypothetical protein V8S98_01650 [Lachnospiraceae bacterium]